VVHSIDQMVEHWVAGRVHQLVDHRLAIHQLHDAGLFRRPEVLPSAPQGILTAGQELVKVLDELRIAACAIVDHGMIVVAHRAGQQDIDVTAHGGV
jgi:hypothetical protein